MPSCSPASMRASADRILSEIDDLVDVNGEATGHQRRHLGELLVAPHRRADDLQLLEEHHREVDLRCGPRRSATHDEAATWLERTYRLVPGRRSDALDDDVGADVPSLRRRVDDFPGSHRQRRIALGLTAARRHDFGAEMAGDRQRRGGDPGADADDEDGLPGSNAGSPQHAIGRERGQWVCRALLPRTAGGARHDVARRSNRVGCVPTPDVLAEDGEAAAHRAVVAESDDVGDR